MFRSWFSGMYIEYTSINLYKTVKQKTSKTRNMCYCYLLCSEGDVPEHHRILVNPVLV